MLKLIRKYQLIILVIGGTLMMVVFLLEPIISRLSPDIRKKAVASLNDGTSFNGLDTQRAEFELSLLKNVYPRAFQPTTIGGFGLDGTGSREAPLHWLMLTKQAEDMGIIGDAAEGRDFIDIISQSEAANLVRQEIQQGAVTPDMIAERLENVTTQIRNAMQRNIGLAIGQSRGIVEEDVYRSLAKARGVQRLFQLYSGVPVYSDVGSLQAAKERFDGYAVDTVVIPGQIVGAGAPAPTDDELNEFFERFKGENPSENEFGIGYIQPTRIKLGWIALDVTTISESIEADRIELRKMWTRDHERPVEQRVYPGDFAAERINIERAYTSDLVEEIMIEADRIIRAQVVQSTSSLSKDGNVYVLPEDWSSTRPSLESMSERVIEGVQEALGITIPSPSVTLATDRWHNVLDVSELEGIGSSIFRVGSVTIQGFRLPQAIYDEQAIELLGLQVGIPQVDPPAIGADSSRYYPIVYESLEEGPALSISDAGYEQVLEDYQSLKGFEMLSERLDAFRADAETAQGLDAVINSALGELDDMSVQPSTTIVRASGVQPGPGSTSVSPVLNNDAFIDAVLEAGAGLDPLSTPEQLDASPLGVAIPIPSGTSVVVARFIAPRPVTIEAYRTQLAQIQMFQSRTEMSEAIIEVGVDPFSFDAFKERYGFEMLQRNANEDDGA